MDAVNVPGLTKLLLSSTADVDKRSSEIAGRDLVIFIGCTGSGKSTVSLHVLGVTIIYDKGDLKAQGSIAGIEIGNGWESKTSGFHAAEVPGTDGLLLADVAGTGDVRGIEADISGALYRSKVLRLARSVRIVLVIHADRIGGGNGRGGPALRDMDHVAGLFADVSKHVESIGIIVTRKIRELQTDCTSSLLYEVKKAAEGLLRCAVAVEDGATRPDQESGSEITPQGLVVLGHFHSHVQRACQVLEEVPEGNTMALMRKLLETRCLVWPANVLQTDQVPLVQRFISSLKPIEQPTINIKPKLPHDCRLRIKASVGPAKDEVIRRILELKWKWANEKNSKEVTDLMVLGQLLEQSQLLQWGSTVRDDIADQLIVQNRFALDEAISGIAWGNLPKLGEALTALLDMDRFRKTLDERMRGLQLKDWISFKAALSQLTMKAGEVLCRHLNAGSSGVKWNDVKWDPSVSATVLGIFSAAAMLQEQGQQLLATWAKELVDEVQRLKQKAQEPVAAAVVKALSTLRDYCEFLPDIIKVLSQHGAESLDGGGLQIALEEAKVGLKEEMVKLSDKVVEERRVSGKPTGSWELLLQLCRSTELQELLADKDLEQTFMMVPLSSAFAPDQSVIDHLLGLIKTATPEQWYGELNHLLARIEGMGELGPQMIRTKKLNFEQLVETVKSEADRAKGEALPVVEKLRDYAIPYRRSMAAPSLQSGIAGDDDDLPMEVDIDEKATDAINALVMLVPGDFLLRMVGPPCAGPAAMALESIGWALKRAVESVLKRAKQIQQRLTWTRLAIMDRDALAALLSLKALISLTQDYLKRLKQVGGPATENLVSNLTETCTHANSFIFDLVNKELQEWDAAKTDVMGWPDVFDRHFQMANSIRPLNPEAVGKAERELGKKLEEWLDRCRKTTDELSKSEGSWKQLVEEMVCKGMAFEDTALFNRKFAHPQFRPLVENLAETWTKEAETAQPASKTLSWQKLKTLSLAIERLPSFAVKDTRTSGLFDKLQKAMEPIDKMLTDHNARFEKLVTEGKYVDASKLLPFLKDFGRHRHELLDCLVRALEAAVQGLDETGTNDEAVRKAQTAKKLLLQLETLPNELKEHLKEHVTTLKEAVAAKSEAASLQLSRALEGGGTPTRALQIRAALTGVAVEQVAEDALDSFVKTAKETLEKMTLEQLVEWILKHHEVKQVLPQEFKSVIKAFSGLNSDFLKCFTSAGQKEAKKCEDFQQKREWGEAKQAHERLRDAIETVEHLDGFSRAHFRQLNGLLGVGASMATALERVRQGDFPIWALVTGNTSDSDALCRAIQEVVAQNMNVESGDNCTAHQRLCVLETFLKEVGEHPPDQLRTLRLEVKAKVDSVSKKLTTKVEKLAEEGLQAASGDDLVPLAQKLEHFKHLEGRADPASKKKLDDAVKQFWDRVRKSRSQVASDIKDLNVAGLSLNLRPIGGWLNSFSRNLTPGQKELLLKSLPGRHADLEDWMWQELQEPVKDLINPEKVESLFRERKFKEISLRFQVSQKLHPVLQQGIVCLDPICKNMQERKERARMALIQKRLEDFNTEYKVLKAVEKFLPEVSVADHLTGLERDVQETLLEQNLSKIRQAERITDAVKPIVDVRNVANKAPDLYTHVTQRLKSALEDVVKSGKFNTYALNTLGGKLAQNGQTGQSVIAELPEVFGSVRDRQNAALFSKFRRAGETHELGEVVGRLTRDTGVGDAENKQLRDALALHEKTMEELESRYFYQEKPLEEIYKEAKQDLMDAVAQCRSENALSAQRVLTHLAACYMVIQSGKEFLEAPPNEQHERLVSPHRAQMLTLYRLLHAHQASNSMWQWLLNFGRSASSKPENHLAQVLTGEGKCLTLGLLAAFLALKGIPCDVVCYRKLLTEQDRAAMQRFYEYVEVSDEIRYVTFDELCEERLESFKDATKALMVSGKSPDARQLRDVTKRALLIDEVDVFFSHKFYGQTWDGAFKLDSPQAKALVRYIFEQKISGRAIHNIQRTEVFQDLLEKHSPEMHPALACAAMSLVRNIENFSKPEPILDEKTGRIGYKEKDEVNWGLSYSNKTVFAYLHYELEGKISKEQADKHLGLDLFCGRFSFAELPKSYCCILGVTGTLRDLLQVPGIRKLLEEEYRFKHYTYTPSVFGDRRLNFREAEDVKVLDNEADWISCIEGLVRDMKDAGHSVLVFFKNEEQLRKFPGASNYECLTERTDPQRRDGYVAAATTSGQVTLLTRPYGRGIDFRMPHDGHEVVVIQTFLSSLVSEQTQIKGRTARQGKPGSYKLALCALHLEGKMGFSSEDVKVLKDGRGEEIRRKLEEKQKQKMSTKAMGMGERKKKAAELEDETRQWEEMLFDKSVPVSTKLQKLAQWNGNEFFQQVHYTVLLDNSGSMSGQPWRQLTEAFKGFKEEILKDPAAAAATQVTTILFNHVVQLITPHHAKAADIMDIGHNMVTGGTDFGVAFKECRQVIGRSSSDTKEIIIFLTDGGAAVPVQEIQGLLADHDSRIKSFISIAFGSANTAALEEIGQLFREQQISVQAMTASDRTSLVQRFKEAAVSRAVHGA